MSFNEWLSGTLSPDSGIRSQAESQLINAAEVNFTQYLTSLTEQLVNANVAPEVRTAAGLALKNALSATDVTIKQQKLTKWHSVDASLRTEIKKAVLSCLESVVHTQVAQVISSIAGIDLPQDDWSDLIPHLVHNMTSPTSSELLKASSMESIGFTCELIDPEILTKYSDPILLAIVNGARKEEPSMLVRVKALEAFNNSLSFIHANFDREHERNIIMQVLCEGTQTNNTEVQVAAYMSLIRVVDHYYTYMDLYMRKALFGVTIFSMQSENDEVILQAIEFWSTLCEREAQIIADTEEQTSMGIPVSDKCLYFARDVLKELVPVLFWLLTKQDEDADEDDWNTSMAAATCLSLLAATVGADIIPIAIPLIEGNLHSLDWRFRDAAVMTFGSILEGPDPKQLAEIVQQALPFLLHTTQDENAVVRDTAAWTLGRVCEHVILELPPTIYTEIIRVLILGLGQPNARIVASSSWALMQFAEAVQVSPDRISMLNPFFPEVTQALLVAAATDSGALSLRMSAYQAVLSWIMAGDDDTLQHSLRIAEEVLSRLDQLASSQSGLSIANQETACNLVAVITSFVRRAGMHIDGPVAERIIQVILRLSAIASTTKAMGVFEDILFCIGAMAQVLESKFANFVQAIIPVIVGGLQAPEEHTMCLAAVGAVSDLARATDRQFVTIAPGFMDLLGRALTRPGVHPSLPPAIITCFGDIALAIGGSAFDQYLVTVMSVLRQAAHAATVMAQSDANTSDFLEDLRDSIIEALVGIVNALSEDNMVNKLGNDLDFIVSISLEAVQNKIPSPMTELLMRNVAGLLGDLVMAFGQQAKSILCGNSTIEVFLTKVAQTRSFSTQTRSTARWARDQLRQVN